MTELDRTEFDATAARNGVGAVVNLDVEELLLLAHDLRGPEIWVERALRHAIDGYRFPHSAVQPNPAQ